MQRLLATLIFMTLALVSLAAVAPGRPAIQDIAAKVARGVATICHE